ncbi:MAG: hypothetical protein ACP5N2_00950 [Candidatus Nanoarchaeia archaeon]
MKKALFAISLLLVLGLLVAGCSKQIVEQENTSDDVQNTAASEENPDEYIEDEIIDENSTVEIGELI